MCLVTMAYVYTACTGCVTIFSTGSNSDWFQILQSYTLLLQPPVLMRSNNHYVIPLNTFTRDHLCMYHTVDWENFTTKI